jgi:hypothetical protein
MTFHLSLASCRMTTSTVSMPSSHTLEVCESQAACCVMQCVAFDDEITSLTISLDAQ